MAYVDGFVLPVQKKHLAAYKKLARIFGAICRENGVQEYFECVAEDLSSPVGVPFYKLLKLKKGETAIFSWVIFKSKAHRNKVHAALMRDPRMTKGPKVMPFDMKRMSWGGFAPIIKM